MAFPGKHSKGIMFSVMAALSLATMVFFTKIAGQSIEGTGVILLSRFFVSFIIVLAIVCKGQVSLKTNNWVGHVFRSIAGWLSLGCLFSSLSLSSMGISMSLSYTIPIFVTLLSMIFFRERFAVSSITGVIICVLAIPVMLNVEVEGLNTGAGLALLSALFGAIALLVIRSLGKKETTLQILFYYLLISSVLSFVFSTVDGSLFQFLQRTDRDTIVILLIIGVTGFFYQFFLTHSIHLVSPTTSSPMLFLAVVVTAIVDAVYFDSPLSLCAYIAMCIIVGCSIYCSLDSSRNNETQ